MFLLDTDVLSALRKRERDANVLAWMAAQRTADLYLNVVSVGEVERGIARQQRRDPAFARDLALWLDSVLALYGGHILPIDVATARRCGRLSDALGHESSDLLVAVTALEHGLTVATGNVRHYQPAGVPVFDPFRAPPPTDVTPGPSSM